MKLPTQRKLDDALGKLAHRYNSTRALSQIGEVDEFRRGYYNGIDVATRELLRLFKVDRDEWDRLLDE